MRIRIGSDIQSIDEVEASIEAFGARYVERVYTRQELESCSANVPSIAVGLAKRFAAKEAVMKLLDMSDLPSPWRAIDIHVDRATGPTVSLSGVAEERAKRRGLDRLSVSLSHTNRLATAVVVGEFAALAQEKVENR